MAVANTRYIFTDCLGEGEISSLTAKGCHYNKKVVQNADDSYNYENYSLDIKAGTENQAIPDGFEINETLVATGSIELQYNDVYTTPTFSSIDGFKFVLDFPALFIMNRKTGVYGPAALQFVVYVRDYNGTGSPVTTHTVGTYQVTACQAGKFQKQISWYGFSDGTFGNGPWDCQVKRISPDYDAYSHMQADSYISYYASISNTKINYADRVIVRGSFDMKEFGGSRPTPHYYGDWLKVEIPNGYSDSGTSASYPGTWDTTWVSGWTNNPAFIWRYIAKHPRFGGKLAEAKLPPDGTIYSFAQYCDEQVDDGKGGTEKRFALNGIIEKQSDADHVLGLIASVFRATPYFGVNGVGLFMDKPINDDPVPITNANVIEGRFTQSSLGGRDRYTIVNVDFTNRDMYGERDRVVVEATPEIRAKYGDKTLDAAAVFCDSYGQAQRMGRNIIQTSLSQNKAVNFSGILDMAHLMPGTLVQIADRYTTTDDRDAGGRIRDITGSVIELDRKITYLTTPTDWGIHLLEPDLTPLVKPVVSVDNSGEFTKITVSTFSSTPIDHSTWQLVHETSNVDIFKWILLTNMEDDDNPLIHHFTALRYDSDKFDIADGAGDYDDTQYLPIEKLEQPTDLDITYRTTPEGQHGLIFSWQSGDDRTQFYELERKESYVDTSTEETVVVSEWVPMGEVYAEEYFHYPIISGEWAFRVKAISIYYEDSVWSTCTTHTIDIDTETPDPPDIGNVWVSPGTYPNTTFNGKDCIITWTEPDWTAYNRTWFRHYKVVVKTDQDGSESILRSDYSGTNAYKYRFDENTEDSLDDGYSQAVREIMYEVYAEDIFGNVSTTYGTLTATNPSPTITSAPILRKLNKALEIKWTIPNDNDGKEHVIYLDTSNPPTTEFARVSWSTSLFVASGLDPDSTYYCQIEPHDLFGAGTKSPVSSSAIDPVLTEAEILEYVKRGTVYTDSEGSSASALAELYDGATASGGVTHSGSDTWRNIQVAFPNTQQVGRVNLWVSAFDYVFASYSQDGSTWNYLKSDGSGGFTAATDSSDAYSNSLYLSSSGFHGIRIDEVLEAPWWRLHHYKGDRTIYELIFRREITVEDIYCLVLNAITANFGSGTFQGSLSSANYGSGLGINIDFNNGKINITNTSGTTVFTVDANGNLDLQGALTVMSGSSGYSNLSDAPGDLNDLDSTSYDRLQEVKRNPPNLIGECTFQLCDTGTTSHYNTYGNWLCSKDTEVNSTITSNVTYGDEYIDIGGKQFYSSLNAGQTGYYSAMRYQRSIPVDTSKVYCIGIRAAKGYSNNPNPGLGIRCEDSSKTYISNVYLATNLTVGYDYDTYYRTIGPSGSGADGTWVANTCYAQPIVYTINAGATGVTSCRISWAFFCEGESPPDYYPTEKYLQEVLNTGLDLSDIGDAIVDPIQRAIDLGTTKVTGGLISTGVVASTHLVTGQAVITESAQIQNAIITGGKLADATITNANIVGGTIRDTEILSTAGLNGRRLAVSNTGTYSISANSSQTITHNAGRVLIPILTSCNWPSSADQISILSGGTNSFVIYNNSTANVSGNWAGI